MVRCSIQCACLMTHRVEVLGGSGGGRAAVAVQDGEVQYIVCMFDDAPCGSPRRGRWRAGGRGCAG
jgi:hypothetical protein